MTSIFLILCRCSCCGLALRIIVLILGTCSLPGELVPLGRGPGHILDAVCLGVEHVEVMIMVIIAS